MKKIIVLIPVLMLVVFSFGQSIYDYPNQLNYSHFPESKYDTISYFSSNGAWFGLSLPQAYDSDKFGSFGGPYSSYLNKWMGESLLKFSFGIAGKGKIELATAADIETDQYPGLLVQKYIFDDYQIEENLLFISGRTCLLKIEAINNSQFNIPMSMMLGGSVFENIGEAEKFTDGWIFKVDGKDDIIWLVRFRLDGEMELTFSPQEYEFSYKAPVQVAPGDTISIVATISQYFKGDLQQDVVMTSDALNYPNKYFKKNEKLWSFLIANIIPEEKELKKVCVKSLQTLYLNLRSYLPSFQNYFFVENSGLKETYVNTDVSWFCASSLIRYDIRLAMHSLASNVLNINENGSLNKYLAILNTGEMSQEVNEMPMAAWTAWNIYSVSPDNESLLRFYPLVEKYHAYWYKYHDVNNNLWCEDANGFETVKLNALLFSEKYCLMKMSEVLGYKDKAAKYKAETDSIKTVFNLYFFDTDLISYVNYDLSDNTKIPVDDVVGYCLWSGLASWDIAKVYAENVEANVNAGFYKSLFKSGFFDIEYYYFLISGLKLYEYNAESDLLKNALIEQLLEKSKDKPLPSFGLKPTEYNNSSLTAAVLLLLLNY